MAEITFDGLKITWEQVAYLQKILSPQQMVTFLSEKNTKVLKNTTPVLSPKNNKTSTFGKSGFN